MRTPTNTQRSLAEALGTFILVFLGSGTVTFVGLFVRIPGLNVLLAGLGLGLGLFIAIMVAGKVSGGHYNPAVTIGLAAVRRFEWADVPAYIIGQVVGAVAGALCIVLVYGTIGARLAGLGAPTLSAGTSIWQGLVIEALGTAILVLAIMGTAVDTRAVAGWAPLAIGLTLAVIILFVGTQTGGSVNPARAFGPDIVAMFFGFPVNWAAFIVSYLIGPLLGGVGGAVLYTAVAGLQRASAPASVGGDRPRAAETPSRNDLSEPAGLPSASA